MKPTIQQVLEKYGPDTAALYQIALEREFTAEEIYFADDSNEVNEPLKPLWGWNLDSLDGAAKFFIREIELDFVS